MQMVSFLITAQPFQFQCAVPSVYAPVARFFSPPRTTSKLGLGSSETSRVEKSLPVGGQLPSSSSSCQGVLWRARASFPPPHKILAGGCHCASRKRARLQQHPPHAAFLPERGGSPVRGGCRAGEGEGGRCRRPGHAGTPKALPVSSFHALR